MSNAATIAPQRAFGKGRLVAKAAVGRTRIAELYQEGCAKIRLPKTFDSSMEAVLINSSGGLTGGDRMDWEIEAGPATELTVTTQACEKIYKASAGTVEVATRIKVAAGARVDWLPQETILFDRASLTRSLDVELDGDATLLAVEAVLLGRKAMGEVMQAGLFRDRWRIRVDDRLLHAENLTFADDIAALVARTAILRGRVAFATLFYTGPDCEMLLPQLRTLIDTEAGGGVSHIQIAGRDKLVGRFAAADGFSLRKTLIPVISHLRKQKTVPKVWVL
ncbi:Urease accessory protein UreD [Ensifer adhaerens]|uniref:urease accessory protein UreD n=1 Tax=Ensifer adhaerens TaxID=106592 RepID=UPI00156A3C06|nr:urease accessory protein UreD [Ensifer adhaerens]NRP23110.1 Urease accessory protein UreD [Ensifer adhaerens]